MGTGSRGAWAAFAAALTVSGCVAEAARGPEAARDPEVFAPGVVSVDSLSVYRGAFDPSGTSFYFFRKVREGSEDYRIYRTERRGDGWGEPEMLPLGDSTASNLYPTVSPDGQRLVFASYRPFPGGEGTSNANLWVARLVDGLWSEVAPLTQLSTPANYDAGPWLASDGSLHFVSTSPDWSQTWFRVARPAGDTWGAWSEEHPEWQTWLADRDDLHVWHALVAPNGQLAIVEVSEIGDGGRPGPSDLWLTRRGPSGWDTPRPLGPPVNTEGTENFLAFTPDGSSLLFARDFRLYWRVDVDELGRFLTAGEGAGAPGSGGG